MKIVVACDSYKGCLSSKEANLAITKGIHKVDSSIEVVSYLSGDGGEGTMEAFVEAQNGSYENIMVHDAYHRMIEAQYGWIDQKETAIIEVSNVIGLYKVPRHKRRPMYASSYGVGEMIADAIEKGCKRIVLALGGSSTNDGGMGLLCALGVRFYDKDHKYLKAMPNNLGDIEYIDTSHMIDLKNIECIAACDVKNHLLGDKGATYVFGPQKGLKQEELALVEDAMTHYAYKMKEIGYDLNAYAGGGAAGGIGAVCMALLHATMKSGVDLLFAYNNIEEDIKDCDLVITGEGQSDKQTLYGKLPVGVLSVAKKYNKPCICISGALGMEYEKLYEAGFLGIFSIADKATSFKDALKYAAIKLENTTYSIIKTICYFIK